MKLNMLDLKNVILGGKMITAKAAQILTTEANQLENHIIRAAKNGFHKVDLVIQDLPQSTIDFLEDHDFTVWHQGSSLTISWEPEPVKQFKPTLKVIK